MHQYLILPLLLWCFSNGKYVFIEKKVNWEDAWAHRRNDYTDLAPLSGERDMDLLRQLAGNYQTFIWFGLMRNISDPDRWMWSGGGEVTWFDWDSGQPSRVEPYGLLLNYRWHDAPQSLASYFCYSVHVVTEEKTWEEALDQCREQRKGLASISSDTEMMLIQRELADSGTTGHVWMGLRFLAEQWLWLDGSATGFDAWGQEGKPECPVKGLHCGALMVNSGGVSKWEARNCLEKLQFICN